MNKFWRWQGLPAALGLVMAIAVARPAAAGDSLVCADPNTRPMLVFDLFFGRGAGDGSDVGNEAWEKFAQDTLAAKLPGLTAIDATGQWFDPKAKRMEHESTKYVIAALPDRPGSFRLVREIVAAYKARFKQRSVGLLQRRECGDFGG
jgi:Protein of unknown function (DUF3574)